MKKRAQGQIFWIIVVAVIVLIVMGVVLYIFSTKLGGVKGEIESCTYKGGECKEKCDLDDTEVKNSDCSGDEPVCCISLFK